MALFGLGLFEFIPAWPPSTPPQMSCLCVWLFAPNKLSIKPVFFCCSPRRPVDSPSLPIVAALTPGRATHRTNCPQMASPNGMLVRCCGAALISSRASLHEQKRKQDSETIASGTHVTPGLRGGDLPLGFIFLCRRRGQH